MYGFLDREFKLRRLDTDTDITYIYDIVQRTTAGQQAISSVVTREAQKLKQRYKEYLTDRKVSESDVISITTSTPELSLTTDDEKIVLCYILEKNIRKVSKGEVMKWLHENEIYNVNVNNAFDLLSLLGNGNIKNEILELNIDIFRRYSANASSYLLKLKPYQEKHIKLASDTFRKLWEDGFSDEIYLFIDYIIEERVTSLEDRWVADLQVKSIQQWEAKQTLDSTLSDNYGSCLELFKQHNLVYESNWTSYGNPREYALCSSLQNLFFSSFTKQIQKLQQVKDKHIYDLPF